jgi:hypothetical protein
MANKFPADFGGTGRPSAQTQNQHFLKNCPTNLKMIQK